MTVDALVNLFVEQNKSAESPLAKLQNEPESQRQEPFTASSPHPIPNASAPFHECPTTGHPAALDGTEHSSRRVEAQHKGSEAPKVDRCVDLDIFSPPPPSPLALAVNADCAFCGTAGTPATCGALVAVRLGEQNAAVHHACALWAPQVYQPQGCDEYLNLESEWSHSQTRRCLVCNSYGAAVTCTHAGCRAAYHLPCAAIARNVSLDKSSFELWCPKHASIHYDTATHEEEEAYQTSTGGRGSVRHYARGGGQGRGSAADRDDEEFSPGQLASRPRRNAALSRKHRFQRPIDGNPSGGASSARERAAVVAATAAAAVAVSDRTQRPRTDWQRQGDAWVKVVPPWWCEHRTIHFANKVFRELFCGHTSAFLVDADGTEWDCLVSCETRNDMRLQYTLRGQFQEYWDTAGVQSGDVLTFQRNVPSVGKIQVGRYPQGRGLEAALDIGGAGVGSYVAPVTNNNTASKESISVPKKTVDPPHLNESRYIGSGGGGSLRIREQQQQKQQISSGGVGADAEGGSAGLGSGHPNRWTDLPDGSAAKTVYKSTLVHQQCPIAGWLYRKLYGRSPGDTDTAPMRDPALGANFIFEVAFVPAANVHYISGRAFGAWMKAAGVQSGDQIRVWRDTTGVKICRMASNTTSGKFGSALALLEESLVPTGSTVVSPLYEEHQTFTSPPAIEALAALNALAAAAGYAGQHGTPAIDAVLSHAAELRNIVNTSTNGEQNLEVDALLSIGDELKMRLAAAGMPLPPSPFLTGAASEKKRKNESLAYGSVSKQPRYGNTTNKTQFPVLAASAAQGAGSASAGVPAPSAQPANQLLLQQTLQQLIRHYQMQNQQQQQNNGATTVTNPNNQQQQPAAAALFHRATPAASNPQQNSPSTQRQHHHQFKDLPPLAAPSSPTFAAVTAALGLHQWSLSEAALLVQFRATCAVLDSVGRDIAFTNVLQLKNNKQALLDMIRGVVEAERSKNASATPLNNRSERGVTDTTVEDLQASKRQVDEEEDVDIL